MILGFCYKGKTENSFVVFDTVSEVFSYFKTDEAIDGYITVKSKKDFDRIMDAVHSERYALKIGG